MFRTANCGHVLLLSQYTGHVIRPNERSDENGDQTMAPKPLAAIRRIVASTDHVIIEGFRAMSRAVSPERDPDLIPSRSGCFAETCRCHPRHDLTRTDDCLVCGAYEAVAAGTPLIVQRHGSAEELLL